MVGDVAEVTVEITRGNGNVSPVHYKLIKEQGVWKIDGVSVDSASQANEPLHSESAVEDVVRWARDTGASNLKSWIEKQAPPAICKAPVVDRATLPDEVKYLSLPKIQSDRRRQLCSGSLALFCLELFAFRLSRLTPVANRSMLLLHGATSAFDPNSVGYFLPLLCRSQVAMMQSANLRNAEHLAL